MFFLVEYILVSDCSYILIWYTIVKRMLSSVRMRKYEISKTGITTRNRKLNEVEYIVAKPSVYQQPY
jgi:hypothetical protein